MIVYRYPHSEAEVTLIWSDSMGEAADFLNDLFENIDPSKIEVYRPMTHGAQFRLTKSNKWKLIKEDPLSEDFLDLLDRSDNDNDNGSDLPS